MKIKNNINNDMDNKQTLEKLMKIFNKVSINKSNDNN